MATTLNVKAFFFNSKTDYLPYYKQFKLALDATSDAKSMLVAIKEQNENFAYPELNLVFKVNNLVVEGDTPLADIVEKLGTELKIDPVNSYRSVNGLIINNNDFMQSFDLIAPYAATSDKDYYKSLYALHYASETSNFDRNYIGDAVLVTAHKMINEGHEEKENILEAISTVNSGLFDCEYENNLFYSQDHTADIDALKQMLKPDEKPSFLSKLIASFSSKADDSQNDAPEKRTHKAVTIDNLLEKNIAYYPGSSTNDAMDKLLDEMSIPSIPFSRAHKLSGCTIIDDNKSLALKKAGTTLMDAYDAGAEVFVVENTEKYKVFVKYFSAIEKQIGRELLGLEIICVEDFVDQLSTI